MTLIETKLLEYRKKWTITNSGIPPRRVSTFDPDESFFEEWLKSALEEVEREAYEKAKQEEKAHIEQGMVYLFRKLPEWFIQKPRYMSKKRRDSLWSHLCMWTDEYISQLKQK